MNNQASGVSANFLLFLVFLVLKLTDVITWSWLWVTSPLWIPLAFGSILLLFTTIAAAIFDNRN